MNLPLETVSATRHRQRRRSVRLRRLRAAALGARVVGTHAVGNARVEGTHGVILSGRQESISVSRGLEPGRLVSDAGQRAMFSQVTDGVLFVTGFLAPYAPILSADDRKAAAGQGEETDEVGADSQPKLALSDNANCCCSTSIE